MNRGSPDFVADPISRRLVRDEKRISCRKVPPVPKPNVGAAASCRRVHIDGRGRTHTDVSADPGANAGANRRIGAADRGPAGAPYLDARAHDHVRSDEHAACNRHGDADRNGDAHDHALADRDRAGLYAATVGGSDTRADARAPAHRGRAGHVSPAADRRELLGRPACARRPAEPRPTRPQRALQPRPSRPRRRRPRPRSRARRDGRPEAARVANAAAVHRHGQSGPQPDRRRPRRRRGRAEAARVRNLLLSLGIVSLAAGGSWGFYYVMKRAKD